MKLKMLLIAIGVVGICFANPFQPQVVNNKMILAYFKKLLPSTTINNIYTTPYPEIYALILGSNILYGNMRSNYLVVGHMFDIYSKDDITDTLVKMNTPKFDIRQINIQDAILAKSPNKVNKKLIIFLDPDCHYCKALEKNIEEAQINQKADIYYILMPLNIHPEARMHSKNILCSKFPINTLKESLISNGNPKIDFIKGCNIDPILERTGDTVRALGISGTPSIVTGEGELILGNNIEAILKYVNNK